MICPNCRTTINDDAIFCGLCGYRMQAQSNVPVYDYQSQPYFAPYPEPTYAPQPPRKKKTWLVITAIVLVLAILAAVVLILLSGSDDAQNVDDEEEAKYAATPEEVVEDYYEAFFYVDNISLYECTGLDYKEHAHICYEDNGYDVDYLVDIWLDEEEWSGGKNYLEFLCDIYGLDYEKWESKLDDVDDIDGFIDFEIDFNKAKVKTYIKKYECGYEIKKIEEEELSGSDLRDAEERFESWYYRWSYYEDALLFDEDDVEGYYLVTGKVGYEYEDEHDGEKHTERFSMLVVETEDGCFIIDTDWEPDD